MEETRSAVLKRRISELEAKNERLEQDNKKLKQECECYEVKQLKQGMEELHAALKPRFFSAWICTSICPKREFGQKAVRFQIPVFYLESYRFLPSTLKGCQHGP